MGRDPAKGEGGAPFAVPVMANVCVCVCAYLRRSKSFQPAELQGSSETKIHSSALQEPVYESPPETEPLACSQFTLLNVPMSFWVSLIS